VDGSFFTVNAENNKIKYGRTINDADMENEAAVAVVSENFAMAVFGTTNCIGEVIPLTDWMSAFEIKVVGVLESDESSNVDALFAWYQEMYVPLSLVQNMFFNGSTNVGNITVKVTDADRIDQIGENIVRLIELNHDNEDKYQVSTNQDAMGEMDAVIGIFTMFMGVVASISLLVGGIGVMNIMLVSVTERTREIGIRKSLGATNMNIQFQFLIEALILTSLGGVVGMGLGYLGGMGFGAVASMVTPMGLTPRISVSTVMLVVSISMGIGIVFGVYPAAKAARLDPIEALRFE
jgi:putative ABC transport system permease protein